MAEPELNPKFMTVGGCMTLKGKMVCLSHGFQYGKSFKSWYCMGTCRIVEQEGKFVYSAISLSEYLFIICPFNKRD